MTDRVFTHTHARSPLALVAVALEVILGLGAIGGGLALMLGPRGEILPLPVALLNGSPFQSYFAPGLILLTFIGIGPLVVAWLAWSRQRWAPLLTLAVGLALLIWMAVEVAVIGYASKPPLQPIYIGLGIAITAVGSALCLPNHRDPESLMPARSPFMIPLFAVFLVLHGLIHVLGTAKAFGIAEMPMLTRQIDRPLGMLWLLAATLLVATALSLFTWPRWWWAVGAGALLVSQVVIVTSWTDARYGTIANVIVLAGVALGFLSQGPWSFRAEYDRDLAHGLGRAVRAPALTEADLAPLPAAVQRYIRLTGAVGQPRVQNFHARFHGQIRSSPDARWMSFSGEQSNFYDQPSRLFLMSGSMFGVPFQAFHRFIGPTATMRVKVASAVTIVDAKGAEMDEAETVTLFNDLCIFAPGALIDPRIQWQVLGPQTVGASFTNLSHTVHAVLSFNQRGELADFVADGRAAASADGKSFTKMPWSTPLADYREFGAHRLMTRGEGIWHAPLGNYSYLRFDLDAIEYNVAAPPSQ